MTTPDLTAQTAPLPRFPLNRLRFFLGLLVFGFLVFVIGIDPGLFGLNRSSAIGFVQIIVLLLGLALMGFAGHLALASFWPKGEKSLLADFGSRTIATGYVVCLFAALADAFGLGTNPMPDVFLGELQSRGLVIGMVMMLIGLLMCVRWQFPKLARTRGIKSMRG